MADTLAEQASLAAMRAYGLGENEIGNTLAACREALLGAEAEKQLVVIAALAAQRERDAKVAKAHKKLAVIAAQEAERERCAKVAEAHAKAIQEGMDGSDDETFCIQSYAAHNALEIAAAIRAQEGKT